MLWDRRYVINSVCVCVFAHICLCSYKHSCIQVFLHACLVRCGRQGRGGVTRMPARMYACMGMHVCM